jgi:hypothetical protein
LVFTLDVDGGQHAVRAHAAKQPDTADTGAGAHLDDCLGVAGSGDEAQRGAGGRADRGQGDLGRLCAGGGQDGVLGDVRLGEVAGLGSVLLGDLGGRGDGAPPCRSSWRLTRA